MSSEYRYTLDFVRKYKFDDYEFGIPFWNNTLWHKIADDHFVLSYSGERIYEIEPDGCAYLIINKHFSPGVKNRWRDLLAVQMEINTKKLTRANGLHCYRFDMRKIVSEENPVTKRNTYRCEKIGSIEIVKRVKIWDGKKIVCEVGDESGIVAVKDNAKYRAFNVKLKQLRAILSGQAKMGVYDKFAGRWYPPLSDELEKLVGCKHPSFADTINHSYQALKKWLDSGDETLVREMGLCFLRNHHSEASQKTEAVENIRRRLMNGCKALQTRYLREHCVTISHSNNSLSPSDESDDQDSVLQPPAGLREMQAPCQAEIC